MKLFQNYFSFASFCLLLLGCSNKQNVGPDIDLIPAQIGDKWGYLNLEGQVVIQPIFGLANYFVEERALIADSTGFGYIDKTGNWAVKPKYLKGTFFSEGLSFVSDSNGIKCINENGEEEFTIPNAEFAWVFSDGLAKISIDGLPKFVDKNGQMIIQPDFTNDDSAFSAKNVSNFVNGFAEITLNGKKGFINKEGKIQIKPIYESVGVFSNGLCPASIIKDKKQLWGYIDEKGADKIPFQYESAREFNQNGLAFVKSDNLWGVIDNKGNRIIKDQFNEITNFENNLAAVSNDKNLWGIINIKGEYVLQPQFDNLSNIFRDYIYFEKYRYNGFLTINGHVLFLSNYLMFNPSNWDRGYFWDTLYHAKPDLSFIESPIEPSYDELSNIVNDKMGNLHRRYKGQDYSKTNQLISLYNDIKQIRNDRTNEKKKLIILNKMIIEFERKNNLDLDSRAWGYD